MAVRTIKVVEDNTGPPQLLTLKRDGIAIDVTGCTVALIIARGNTITNTSHQACLLAVPASGVVQYNPAAGDFATKGTYKADVKITYPNATEEILYDQLKFKVRKKLG